MRFYAALMIEFLGYTMESKQKRLFFGLEVLSAWPESWPRGKIIEPAFRHMTIAFLGNCDYPSLQELLQDIPKPECYLGLSGVLDTCLFLPEKSPHVVCFHMQFFALQKLMFYREMLRNWLREHTFLPKEMQREEFLPHMTIARGDFEKNAWEKMFIKLPFVTKNIHLYESLGNSQYRSLWEIPIVLPMEEKPHMADLAFIIRGENSLEMHQNALIALAFHFPPLISYFPTEFLPDNLDLIIFSLNQTIAKADTEIGCPFKAVSFHGEIKKTPEGFLEWEMIVDV